MMIATPSRSVRYLAIVALAGAAFHGAVASANSDAAAPQHRNEPIRPIPLSVSTDTRRTELGRRLFSDPLLSADGTVACATCHLLPKGGADRSALSRGIKGAEGSLNAPTVFNARFNFRQFWDGRAASLEEQVDGPLLSPKEMGTTWEQALAALRAAPVYSRAFREAYPDGITRENVRNALAEFERSLVTPNGRFDRYLRGEEGVLTAAEKSGYRKFKDYGCVACHQGVNVGGNMYQRMGVMRDYFAERGDLTQADFGRFNVTRDEADRFTFKVPSLRNIEHTAPYFHDGSAETLEAAVVVMSSYQLGRSLPAEDIEELVQFLRTLGGEVPGARR